MSRIEVSAVETLRTVTALREKVSHWRRAGETVALVPTMGALHDGHISLMQTAKARADRLVVSIFVNPTQFGAGEDLEAYPRTEASDLEKLGHFGADVAFCPPASEMYGPGFATEVRVTGLTDALCGASRPEHFSGVATIVTKLLMQCQPDFAIFGEKDYQQLLVIRRMVRDLDIPVEIIGSATLREADGLALSSRNANLTPDERKIAPRLHQVMAEMAEALSSGGEADQILSAGRQQLEGFGFAIDYLELRDEQSLAPLDRISSEPARIFAAVRLGAVRLIDNIAVARV